MACSVVQRDERWFGHNDFKTSVEHDVDCRMGGCWPSRKAPFHAESGLNKEEVMKKTHEWVAKNPKNHICQISWCGLGYSYKVWDADECANMLFVRGGGDHALVYSMEKCNFRNKIDNCTWS